MKKMLLNHFIILQETEKKINRIRVEGVSYDDSNIKLDTDSLKLIKHINVTVNEDTGIVDSEDMFNNLNTTLKDI